MSKLRASTLAWAFSSDLFTHGWTIASPSFMPSVDSTLSRRFGPENAHQVISPATGRKTDRPGIAPLTPGPPAQLVVNPAAFVPLGGQHEQPARVFHLLLFVGNFGFNPGACFRGGRPRGLRPGPASRAYPHCRPTECPCRARPLLVAIVTAPKRPASATNLRFLFIAGARSNNVMGNTGLFQHGQTTLPISR